MGDLEFAAFDLWAAECAQFNVVVELSWWQGFPLSTRQKWMERVRRGDTPKRLRIAR